MFINDITPTLTIKDYPFDKITYYADGADGYQHKKRVLRVGQGNNCQNYQIMDVKDFLRKINESNSTVANKLQAAITEKFAQVLAIERKFIEPAPDSLDAVLGKPGEWLWIEKEPEMPKLDIA